MEKNEVITNMKKKGKSNKCISTNNCLYHYTNTLSIGKILEVGYLKLTESNLHNGLIDDGYWDIVAYNKGTMVLYRPVVWLTENANTTMKDIGMGNLVPGIMYTDKTEIRITVLKRKDMYKWKEWSRKNNIDPKWAWLLENGTDKKSWWVTEQIVTMDEVIEIKNMRTGEILWKRENAA